MNLMNMLYDCYIQPKSFAWFEYSKIKLTSPIKFKKSNRFTHNIGCGKIDGELQILFGNSEINKSS